MAERSQRWRGLWWAQCSYWVLVFLGSLSALYAPSLWVVPSWVFLSYVTRGRRPNGVGWVVLAGVAAVAVIRVMWPSVIQFHHPAGTLWAVGTVIPLVCVPFGRSGRIGEVGLRLLTGVAGSGIWFLLFERHLLLVVVLLVPFYAMELGSAVYESLSRRRRAAGSETPIVRERSDDASPRPARRPLSRGRKVAISLMAGIAVIVLLLPARGDDSSPPRCYSMFGYEVPCADDVLLLYDSLALAAGAVTSGMVGLALWLDGRRRRTEDVDDRVT